MSKTSTSGRKTPMGCEDMTLQADNQNTVKYHCDHPHVFEQYALHVMDDMMNTYRKEFLRLRRDYKILRDQESALGLAHIHIRHKLKQMDETIRRDLKSYGIMRIDYAMQKSCVNSPARHANRLPPYTDRKAKTENVRG